MLKKWITILLTAAMAMSMTACSMFGGKNVIYVDSTKNGNGKSWNRAYGDLADALEAAEAGDEIWIAAGTYTPENTANKTFEMKDGVAVYGGFGGFERSVDDRKVKNNPTILSGVMPDGTTANHVVVAANALLDGLTISSGKPQPVLTPKPEETPVPEEDTSAPEETPFPEEAPASEVTPVPEAETPVSEESAPSEAESQPESDEAATASYAAPAAYTAVPLSSHAAPATGRAVMLNAQVPVDAQRTEQQSGEDAADQAEQTPAPQPVQNSASMLTREEALNGSYGGGILIYGSAPLLNNCTIKDLTADMGGGVYIGGVDGLESVPSFVGCTISHNNATAQGGGVVMDANANANFIDCVFDANSSDSMGGAMYNCGSSPMLYNCLFVNNLAENGAGMGNEGGSSPRMINCTFAYNTASEAGAALYQGTGAYNDPVLQDCIISSNSCRNDVIGVYNWNESTPSISYSVVQNGYVGEGNVDLAPTFSETYVATSEACKTASSVGGQMGYLGTTTEDIAGAMSRLNKLKAAPQPVPMDTTQPTIEENFYNYVVFVTPDGTGSGKSWKTAANLQNAINIANHMYETKGKAPDIWLASGTYTPGDSRTDSFVLLPGVTLYGGFNGTEEYFSQRKPAENFAVLSGEIGDPSVKTDNCYHVVIGADNATLDGLTITGGYADGVGGQVYDEKGGGLLNYAAGERVIPDHTPTLGFNITIRDCVFKDNYAKEGGALYTNHGGNPVLEKVTFEGNSAVYGGAVVDRAGTNAVYTDCVFRNNIATYKGGASFTDYGAMAQFKGCTFANNTAGTKGGALYAIDRNSKSVPNETSFTLLDPTWTKPTDGFAAVYVENSTFTQNYAASGSDLYLYDGAWGKLVGNTYGESTEVGENVVADKATLVNQAA